jgi:formylmethanofuran dehydrogenase subunit E
MLPFEFEDVKTNCYDVVLSYGLCDKLEVYGRLGMADIKGRTIWPSADWAANKQSDFFKKYREKGVPASQVPPEAVDPLVEWVMNAPENGILNVGDIFEYKWTDAPHSFDSFVCEACGEMTAEIYGRILSDKKVCIPCRQKQ